MAERKRNMTHPYVGDNLARRLEPAHRPVTREEIQIRRNRERTRSMSLAYVAAMTVVVGVTLLICLRYLSLQNSINSRLHNNSKGRSGDRKASPLFCIDSFRFLCYHKNTATG